MIFLIISTKLNRGITNCLRCIAYLPKREVRHNKKAVVVWWEADVDSNSGLKKLEGITIVRSKVSEYAYSDAIIPTREDAIYAVYRPNERCSICKVIIILLFSAICNYNRLVHLPITICHEIEPR